jgi:serine/threonine protein phosphatase 1
MPKHTFLPKNTRVYAVGDIHGSLNLLKKLLDEIVFHEKPLKPKENLYLVFLGDYIDRGLNSKKVIKTLLKGLPKPFTPIFLKGNHEQMMLDALLEDNKNASADFDHWCYNGGKETMISYGVNCDHDYELIKKNFSLALEKTGHKDFFINLRTSWSMGAYFFCHAGIRPGVALTDQKEEELLWIRARFLQSTKQHEKIIVHGHTPEKAAHYGNRIGLDSGSSRSGKLSAACLHSDGASQILTIIDDEDWIWPV